MNYIAINSGCHFPVWPDGMVHWACLVPQASAAGLSGLRGHRNLCSYSPPETLWCFLFWVWPNTNRVRVFSPPYWKHFEEGALELVRNQGQSPSDCNWCQIKSQVDMVVVSHAGAEDFTVPPFCLPTVWKVLIYSLLPLIPQVFYGHFQIMKNRIQIYIWNVCVSEYLFKVL